MHKPMNAQGSTRFGCLIAAIYDRFMDLGRRFDDMAYPNRDHGLREGPGSVVRVRMLMARYLIQHLLLGPQ
jgi:dipeptidyl-peptidase-4